MLCTYSGTEGSNPSLYAKKQGIIRYPVFLCCSVLIDDLNRISDPTPKGHIGEHLYNAASVGEGRFLQEGQILHHAVVDNVFDDLVDKVDLPVIKIRVAQIFGEGLSISI